MHQGDLAGITFAGKHGLSKKGAAHRHSIQSALETLLVPGLDRMGETEIMKVAVALDDDLVDPSLLSFRATHHHIPEGSILAHFVGVAPERPSESVWNMEALIERNHPSLERRKPQDFARLRHRKDALGVSTQQDVGGNALHDLISIVRRQVSTYIRDMNALVIDLTSLPEEGKVLRGELSDRIFELRENDAKALGPLRYDLHAQRFGDELLLRGQLSAPFEFQCVRTLTRFKKTIALESAAISLEIGTQAELDATEAVREEILLEFPAYPRCDEGDEPQPCEVDPRYLAVDKPGGDDVEVPPASGGDSRWAALDALESPEEPS